MSATNSTPIINLPLFIGTDKPAWLVDWNGAMNTIDTAIANLQTAESGTATSLASLAQSVEALSGTVSQHTTAIQTVTTATAGNTGSINTINSLIGNGEPTTEDKTIIGAINEIYAEIGGGTGVAAEDVTYSNTTSGLTATDVQAAIDEVNAKIPSISTPDAEDVSYDNTSSGLTADNVQAAIDELAQGGAAGKTVKATYSATGTGQASAMTAAMKTGYDALTLEQKLGAVIVVETATDIGQIYTLCNAGTFTAVNPSSTSLIESDYINLNNGGFFRCDLTTTASISNRDTAAGLTFKLYA